MDNPKHRYIDLDDESVVNDPMIELAQLLAHPEVRSNQRITNEDEILYPFYWIGFFDANGNRVDPQAARLCSMQLGLQMRDGRWNKPRIAHIADFIWSQHPAKPDPVALVCWLKQYHPMPQSQPVIQDKARFLKKQKRKRKKAQRTNKRKPKK